jgi:penicillin-binding protein 2
MSFHPNEMLRRARVARAVLVLAFTGLGAAFFRAQVIESAQYVARSEMNRLREVPVPGARGTILDRRGEVIAENLPGYTVMLISPTEDSLRTALGTLAGVVPLDSAQQAEIVRRYRRSRPRPAVIFNNAPFAVVSALEERRVEFPGLIIQSAPKRYYPEGRAFSAVLGYTAEISEPELALEAFDGYKAGQVIGKSGLERQYESRLRGMEGTRFIEVDARNRIVRDEGVRAEIPATAPPPLRTTLDLDLQRYAHSLFGDSLQGGLVALDPGTGGVLALYSAPTFDLNRFTGGVSKSYFDSLNTDKRRPMYIKAFQGFYPPASTWKLATAIIAMERGLAGIDTHMGQPCTGGYQFGGRYFKCWNKRGHGDVNMAQAIAQSCDVYFYQLGLRIGLTNLVAGGIKLGFADRTGIDLPSETRSRFPFPDARAYYNALYPKGWTNAVTLNLSIGQGENDQTVINMARFYAALATDGSAPVPHIVEGPTDRRVLFSLTPKQLQELRMAMADVVSGRGTAGSAAIQGLRVAGKTGTAQNSQGADHAWFVGFAPLDSPKIVVAVMLEFGEHGYHAARIATKVMERYLRMPLENASTSTATQ